MGTVSVATATAGDVLARLFVPALATATLAIALALVQRRRSRSRTGGLALGVLIAATLPFAVIAKVRPSLRAGDGIHGRYYANVDWSGYPQMTAVDPRPSIPVIDARWNRHVPEKFSIRWTGYLTVDHDGIYEFATTSDDGTRLTIDDQRVVSNEGAHVALRQTGSLQLRAGSHRFVLDYVQYGGGYALDWTWADRAARTSQSRPGGCRSRAHRLAPCSPSASSTAWRGDVWRSRGWRGWCGRGSRGPG